MVGRRTLKKKRNRKLVVMKRSATDCRVCRVLRQKRRQKPTVAADEWRNTKHLYFKRARLSVGKASTLFKHKTKLHLMYEIHDVHHCSVYIYYIVGSAATCVRVMCDEPKAILYSSLCKVFNGTLYIIRHVLCMCRYY